MSTGTAHVRCTKRSSRAKLATSGSIHVGFFSLFFLSLSFSLPPPLFFFLFFHGAVFPFRKEGTLSLSLYFIISLPPRFLPVAARYALPPTLVRDFSVGSETLEKSHVCLPSSHFSCLAAIIFLCQKKSDRSPPSFFI